MSINKKTKDTDVHIRCVKCKKLLAKGLPDGYLEIKCLRCGVLNRTPDPSSNVGQIVVRDSRGDILYKSQVTKKRKKHSV